MVDYTGNIHSVMLIEGYFARLSACVYVCLSVCVCMYVCVYVRDQTDGGLYRKHSLCHAH